MITKRIIPCLDVKDGRVVKGVNFAGLHDVSSPVELAEFYTNCGADELVFYDITASAEGRRLFTDILNKEARDWFGEQYRFLLDQGIEGFWNDMNEPSIFYAEDRLADVLGELARMEEYIRTHVKRK